MKLRSCQKYVIIFRLDFYEKYSSEFERTDSFGFKAKGYDLLWSIFKYISKQNFQDEALISNFTQKIKVAFRFCSSLKFFTFTIFGPTYSKILFGFINLFFLTGIIFWVSKGNSRVFQGTLAIHLHKFLELLFTVSDKIVDF